MQMQTVKSSTIEAIGYDEQTHKLRVSFRKYKSCDFCHVPKNVFVSFLNSRSKDRYYKRNIQANFPC